MPTKSTATSEDVSETLESCNSFSFREIDFTSLQIDDLVELYDVMRLLFYCPHGDFLEGESFLQYFSPNNADSERYLERLRTWLQKQSLCSVDFDSSDLKEDVLKMRKNLYKWTKIAKRCFVRRSTKDSSGGTGELLPSRDNADRNDILSTKELITLAMECRQKQRADSSIPTEAEDDTAIPTRTSSRKRKRNQKNIPLTSHYFDEELSLLKPLLIFDLNKVLVWRRKKSMCFVIRPHAMEVAFDAT